MSLLDLLRPAGEPDPEPPALDHLDESTAFEILSATRRRATARLLAETPEMTIGALAEQIAAAENGRTVKRLTAQQRKRVYITLHQHHLPKLARAGVVDWDNGTVAATDALEDLLAVLAVADGGER